MARKKGTGYNPDTFDIQFVKILLDLQGRDIDLAKNEKKFESILGLTPGVIWKIKNMQTGISKFKRDQVVKNLQRFFEVDPVFFANRGNAMYLNGEPVVHYKDMEPYPERISNLLTAGDHIQISQLKTKMEYLEEQLKAKDEQIITLQSQVRTLEKLVALYEKSAK